MATNLEKPTLYQLASKFINEAWNTGSRSFLEEMRKMHPTEQQIFAGLILTWLSDYTRNYRIDDRNKQSIEECRKLLDSFKAVNEEELRTKFPLI